MGGGWLGMAACDNHRDTMSRIPARSVPALWKIPDPEYCALNGRADREIWECRETGRDDVHPVGGAES
jgi:hypothetical protein